MKRLLLATLIWLAPLCASLAQVTGVSPAQMFGCNLSAQTSTVGSNVKLVSGLGTLGNGAKPQIYLCPFTWAPAGTTPTMQLFWATAGTSCASSNGTVTPVMSATSPIVAGYPTYSGLPPVPNGQDLCVALVGAGSSIIVFYTQF